jgi:hypothetical protein
MAIGWKSRWVERVRGIERHIAADQERSSWREAELRLQAAHAEALAERIALSKAEKKVKKLVPGERSDIELRCLKNLRDAVRFIKYRLADASRHTQAFRAAAYQNKLTRRIAAREGNWARAGAYLLHEAVSYYNTSLPRFGIFVLGMIVAFAIVFGVLDMAGVEPIIRADGWAGDVCWYHYLYYSTVTFVTLGYGDFCPNPDSPLATLLSALEALVGYVLLGVFIYLLFHLSETHPFSPPWAEEYVGKLERGELH